MKVNFNELNAREQAVILTIKHFKDKDGVSEVAFMSHLEKIYNFLLGGSVPSARQAKESVNIPIGNPNGLITPLARTNYTGGDPNITQTFTNKQQ